MGFQNPVMTAFVAQGIQNAQAISCLLSKDAKRESESQLFIETDCLAADKKIMERASFITSAWMAACCACNRKEDVLVYEVFNRSVELENSATHDIIAFVFKHSGIKGPVACIDRVEQGIDIFYLAGQPFDCSFRAIKRIRHMRSLAHECHRTPSEITLEARVPSRLRLLQAPLMTLAGAGDEELGQ